MTEKIEKKGISLHTIYALTAMTATGMAIMIFKNVKESLLKQSLENRITMEIGNGTSRLESTQRYEVTRVCTFEDDFAFKGQRGIYEIKDKKTGKEYFGISGIGISERSEIPGSGKTSAMEYEE